MYSSYSYSITTGDIGGTITAKAGNDFAFGLFHFDGSITTGAITGTISATAGNESAYGLRSTAPITTGAINGTIIADAGDGAHCLSTNGDLTVGGTIGSSANITATSVGSGAACLSTSYGTLTTGDIDGRIAATTYDWGARGLRSDTGAIITGNISGTITAWAADDDATGLLASRSSITVGDVDGTITATSLDNGAFGLNARRLTTGDINGTISADAGDDIALGLYSREGSVTTGAIRGTISANASGDIAYGILSYGPMDIKVDGGVISAIANTGSNVAAIQSGKMPHYDALLETQDTDDTVEIVAGSTIIGDIDLGMHGTDRDVLFLSGANANSTTLDYDIRNIETINITGGRWYVNGTVYNSTNGIAMTGGILSGTGTLGSLSVISGTLAPGSSIGTTTVNGNLAMDTGSTLEIEIDNSGNSDKLVVTGGANIAGGTVKPISTETITDSQEYVIVQAQSVSGRFDAVDTALLHTTLSYPFVGTDYLADSVLLKIFPFRFDHPDIVTTGNQRAVGSALQIIADDGGNSITTRLQQPIDLAEVRDAYDQLCGQAKTSLAPVTMAGTARHVGTVSDRLYNARSTVSYGYNNGPLLAMAEPDDVVGNARTYDVSPDGRTFAVGNGTGSLADRNWGVWGKGYAVFGDRESESGIPGYQYAVYGTGFGVDYQFTDALLLGITGGYSEGEVDHFSSSDTSTISSIPLGVYGSWHTDEWYFDSLLSYAGLQYETERYVDLTSEKLSGDFDGDQIGGYFEGGLNWHHSESCLIQPLASFQFSHLNLDSYTESGGASSLGYDDQSYQSYKGSLGLKLTKHLGKDSDSTGAAVELRGRWIHEFGDAESQVDAHFASDPGAEFTVSDEDISRDSTVLGTTVHWKLGRSTRLFASYDASLNADNTSNIVSAGLEHRW